MRSREADDRLVRVVRALAVQATLVVAGVHLLWAALRFGAADDIRPHLFVVSGVFLVIIAAAVFRGAHYRRLYVLGAGVLGAHLLGYVYWHGVEAVASALLGDPLAIVAKFAEVVGIGAFLVLFVLAPPTSVAAARRPDRFEESILSDIVDESDFDEMGGTDDITDDDATDDTDAAEETQDTDDIDAADTGRR